MSSIFYIPEEEPKKDEEDDKDKDGEGKSGQGNPKLKPNHEFLDPKIILSNQQLDYTNKNQTLFGDWELQTDTLLLKNPKKNKTLNIESLDTPSKMMKVIIALSIQGQWDTENLIRCMDQASILRFNKTLYHLVSSLQDSCLLDWKNGQIYLDKNLDRKPEF